MPKETIQWPEIVNNGTELLGTEVSLHWGDSGTIQLGMVIYYPELVEEGTGVFTGNLDRSQINRLIRALRKARDQSFGRDE